MSTPTNSADASCGELSCDECNARTAALTAERDQLRVDLELADVMYQRECEVEHELRTEVERLTIALRDAISTYDSARAETLVTAERQEAWQAALKEGAK